MTQSTVVWHVSGLPPATTSADVAHAICSLVGGGSSNDYAVKMHTTTALHFAFVTPRAPKTSDDAAVAAGVIIRDVSCPIKRRRPPKAERTAAMEKARATKQQQQRRAWQPSWLDRFPRRQSTLCQHAMVAELPADLITLLERAYMPHRFGSASAEVGAALRWAWERHPTSLRCKELFETVEVFSLVEKQIAAIRARAREAQPVHPRADDDASAAPPPAAAAAPPPACNAVEHIYDLACGHGLLGVLCAYRFADAHVVCVDLERPPCFDHYVEAFRACVAADEVSGAARDNDDGCVDGSA